MFRGIVYVLSDKQGSLSKHIIFSEKHLITKKDIDKKKKKVENWGILQGKVKLRILV